MAIAWPLFPALLNPKVHWITLTVFTFVSKHVLTKNRLEHVHMILITTCCYWTRSSTPRSKTTCHPLGDPSIGISYTPYPISGIKGHITLLEVHKLNLAREDSNQTLKSWLSSLHSHCWWILSLDFPTLPKLSWGNGLLEGYLIPIVIVFGCTNNIAWVYLCGLYQGMLYTV